MAPVIEDAYCPGIVLAQVMAQVAADAGRILASPRLADSPPCPAAPALPGNRPGSHPGA